MSQHSSFFTMETAPARAELETWVKQMAAFMEAKNVHWCDGSQEEYDNLCNLLVQKGTFIKLNPEKRPNSFACFSVCGISRGRHCSDHGDRQNQFAHCGCSFPFRFHGMTITPHPLDGEVENDI